MAVNNVKGLPVWHFLEVGAEPFQLIFNEEWHNLGELDLCFLLIGKSGYTLSLYQRLALVCDMTENTWSVANERHYLPGIIERLNQRDRHWALSEIPHRAMPARIEDRVEILRSHIRKFDGICKVFLRRCIFLEPGHGGRLIFWQIALRIDRWLAAFRGGNRQLNTGVSENEVGSGKFFQPETGFAASVAELVVRR